MSIAVSSSTINVSNSNRSHTIHGTGSAQVIRSGSGQDVIYGDHALTWVDRTASNDSRGDALNIDNSSYWSYFSKTDEDGAGSAPYTTVLGEGDNVADYFFVTIGAGQTITVDLDYGFTNLGGGSFDGALLLETDTLGVNRAESFGAGTDLGGTGSYSNKDPYLTWTNTGSTGGFVIRVTNDDGSGVPTGANYSLNISVTGHSNQNIVTEGADIIYAGGGDDRIFGMGGNDTIFGEDGTDRIYGGRGSDLLIGGEDQDFLYGEGGSDILFYDPGADRMYGGSDIDYVTYAAAPLAVTVDTRDNSFNTGSAAGDIFAEVEAFFLSQFNDFFSGEESNNFVYGQNGHDAIAGGGGGDILFGEGGNDFINSGALGDLVSGGEGFDTFYYGVNQIEQDQILDFTPGIDKLAFDDVGFNVVGQSPIAGINFISTTTATGASYAAGQSVFVYFSDIGLLYADTDGAGGADINLIAQLAGLPALTANDFVFL